MSWNSAFAYNEKSILKNSWCLQADKKKGKKSDAMWHELCSMLIYIQSPDHTKYHVAIWNMKLCVVPNH